MRHTEVTYSQEVEFMLEAYRWAEKFSTDPSTQNGAVLVRNGEIVAYGANHFPEGVRDIPERWERPIKYSYVVHAEAASILDAARCGIPTRGLTMYAAWIACAECSKMIIQAGIKEVVGHKPDPLSMAHIAQPNGSWDQSITIGMGMLEEAGVAVRYLEGKLDPTNTIEIKRNSKIFHP